MLTIDHLYLYIGIFALIFLSYLFAQMFFAASGKDGSLYSSKLWHLPLYFRYTLWLYLPCCKIMGKGIRSLMPLKLKDLQRKLLTANVIMPAELIVTAQIVGGLLVFFFLFFGIVLLTGNLLVGLCVGAIIGLVFWIYPASLLEHTVQYRQTTIVRDLPFAIDLLTSAMRSGLDFSAALRYYVENSDSAHPLCQEFSQVLREIELGKNRGEALEDMAQKVDVREFTSVVSAVLHGLEVGASIVDTLKIQGDDLRKLRFSLAEQKAARAPSLMLLPMIIFILPAFLLMVGIPVALRVVGNDAAMNLFNH